MFQELEKTGKISYIEMRRIEFISKVTDHPGNLYENVKVVDKECEEPSIVHPPAVKSGKKSKDVILLSKSLRRLHLNKSKSTKKEGNSQSEVKKETKDRADQLVENGGCSLDAPCPKEVQQEIDEVANEEEELDHTQNFALDSDNVTDSNGYAIIDVESSRGDLGPMDASVTPVDVEKGLEHTGLTSPPESVGVLKKEETDESVENDKVDDVLSICHSRSPSVCSSFCDSRGIDDWGRKDKKPSLDLEDSGQIGAEDWVEVECDDCLDDEPVFEDNNKAIDKSENVADNSFGMKDCKAKEAVKEWLNDRKKFFTSSKDSHFHEYVVDRINPKKPKQSLSESLSSLDSAFSSALSVISREQRKICVISGLSGYGNFDKYNTEYLSKLRSERLASKRRLKPYDVSGSSRRARASIRRRSFNGDDSKRGDDDVLRNYSGTTFCTEERVRRRTYSETISISGRKTRRYRCFSSTISSSMSCHSNDAKMHSRERSRSETDSLYLDSRRSLSSMTSSRRMMSSRSFSGSSLDSFKDHRSASFSTALKNHSMSKEKLYSFWKMRREDYIKARYRSSSSRGDSRDSLALTGYTCGLCFKSFKTRTRREQHSDELMHWACITCGRFFASHTALGQHVDEVGHRKD